MVDPKEVFATTKAIGERIYLKALRDVDISDQYISYYQNQDLVKYMYQTPRKIDRLHLVQELKNGIETNQYHIYGVFDKANDLLIGNIRVGFITWPHRISDLAIFIGNTEYLGKGIAQEAIQLGNEICFNQYDFRKLHGGMFEANMASVKAYMKAGWLIEGRLRGQYWVEGQAMDRICVACFNPKYFSNDFLQKVKQRSDQYLSDFIKPI